MLKNAIVASVALAFLASGAAAATCPANPYTLSNGTTADATQVMSNFDNLLTCANTLLAPLANARFTGSVGIGTSTPSSVLSLSTPTGGRLPTSGVIPTNSILSIKGSANNIMFAGLDESGPPYGGWIQMTDVTNLSFAYPIALNPNGGYVGVGTYTPQVELTVAGDIRAGISGTNGCLQNFAGTAIAGTCSSDAALKNVVGDVSDILERFGKLQLVHFRWNTTAGAVYHNSASVLNTGFIAQSVEQQFPELVTFDAHRFRQLDYTSLNLYGLEAIKELKSVVDKQASQIARQSTEIAALKNLLSRSDERLSSLEGRLQNISTANASGRQKILSSAKL